MPTSLVEAGCACLMRGRRDEASVTHLLSTSPAPRRAAAAPYAPRLRRLSEPTDKAATMREREFFAKKTALLGRQAG